MSQPHQNQHGQPPAVENSDLPELKQIIGAVRTRQVTAAVTIQKGGRFAIRDCLIEPSDDPVKNIRQHLIIPTQRNRPESKGIIASGA